MRRERSIKQSKGSHRSQLRTGERLRESIQSMGIRKDISHKYNIPTCFTCNYTFD